MTVRIKASHPFFEEIDLANNTWAQVKNPACWFNLWREAQRTPEAERALAVEEAREALEDVWRFLGTPMAEGAVEAVRA